MLGGIALEPQGPAQLLDEELFHRELNQLNQGLLAEGSGQSLHTDFD